MRTAVIVLEAMRPATGTDGIDPLARQLYEALQANFRIVLLDTAAAPDTQHWLGVHDITGFVRAYTPPADFAPRTVAEGRLRLLAAVRHVDSADLVIEVDPECAAEEIRAGYNVLLYASPQYLMDIWHPDHQREPRPWDEIVGEIERQRQAKADDIRIKDASD